MKDSFWKLGDAIQDSRRTSHAGTYIHLITYSNSQKFVMKKLSLLKLGKSPAKQVHPLYTYSTAFFRCSGPTLQRW